MFAATLGNTVKSRANLYPFYRIDAHQTMRQISIQAIKYRLAEPDRYAVGDHGDFRPDGVLIAAQLIHVVLELRDLGRVGAEKRILLDGLPRSRNQS